MKTGVIVYVSGDKQPESFLDMETRVDNLSIAADMVAVVSKTEGHFNVHDAWRFLLVKGMQRIICVIAEYAGGEFNVSDRVLRVWG